jgi:hypothetical protein
MSRAVWQVDVLPSDNKPVITMASDFKSNMKEFTTVVPITTASTDSMSAERWVLLD